MAYEIIINFTAIPNQELEKNNIQSLHDQFDPIISKVGIGISNIKAFRDNNVITVSWCDQNIGKVADVFPTVFNTILSLQSDKLKFQKGSVRTTVELDNYNEWLSDTENEQPEGSFIRRTYNIIKFEEINTPKEIV